MNDNTSDCPPLSFGQQWLLSRYKTSNSRLFETPAMAIELVGDFNLLKLREALEQVIRRHEVLRATFYRTDAEWQQIIVDSAPSRIDLHDLTSVASRYSAARKIIRNAAVGIPIDTAPLIRVGLIRLRKDGNILYFAMHHLVSDLMSHKIFIQDLSAFYEHGTPQTLRRLDARYRDFAIWQERWLYSAQCSSQKRYWQTKLASAIPLTLRSDYANRHGKLATYSVADACVSPPVVCEMIALAQNHGATLFMLSYAAFAIVMSRWSGQTDIAVVCPIANRKQRKFEEVLGYFAGNVILRLTTATNSTHRDILHQAREVCIDAFSNSDIPSWKLAEYIPQITEGLAKVFFGFQVAGAGPKFGGMITKTFECTGNTMHADEVDVPGSAYDQKWEIFQEGDSLRVVVLFNQSLYRRTTVLKIIEDFRTTLETYRRNLDQRLEQRS